MPTRNIVHTDIQVIDVTPSCPPGYDPDNWHPVRLAEVLKITGEEKELLFPDNPPSSHSFRDRCACIL